jgi:hypothetical protein
MKKVILTVIISALTFGVYRFGDALFPCPE